MYLCPSLAQTLTLSASNTFPECLPLMVNDLFSSSCLRESAETLLQKGFQVIWWRCLPEAPGNGSFTFFMAGELLLSTASKTLALHEPQEANGRGRKERRDWIRAVEARFCAERENDFVPNNAGSKMSYEWICLYVGGSNFFEEFCFVIIAQEEESAAESALSHWYISVNLGGFFLSRTARWHQTGNAMMTHW